MADFISLLFLAGLLYCFVEFIVHSFNLNLKIFRTEFGFLIRKGILFHQFLSNDGSYWWSEARHIRTYSIFKDMEQVNKILSLIAPVKYGQEVELKRKVDE